MSVRRERQWGLFGGIVGAVFGVSSALIAVYVEGASWRSSSTPYPQFFAHHRLLINDYFLASALIVGALFQIDSLWMARTGRYPRTDTFGGTLVAMMLMLLAGVLLFTRLVAIGRLDERGSIWRCVVGLGRSRRLIAATDQVVER